jgi:hypothetical protein
MTHFLAPSGKTLAGHLARRGLLRILRPVASIALLSTWLLFLSGNFGHATWQQDAATQQWTWTDAAGNSTQVSPSVDSDADGLEDVQEASYGTDPYLMDTDYDGLTDSEEALLSGQSFSPLLWDTNGDLVSDYDQFYAGSASAQPGFMGISYAGGQLPSFPGSTYSDFDGDGVRNPFDPAPDNPDRDGDGIVDGSDAAPDDYYNGGWQDSDGDGTPDWNDYHPYDPWNGGAPPIEQSNSDGDSYNDDMDPAPWDYSNYSWHNSQYWYSDALADADSDGTWNFYDSTPYGWSPSPQSTDMDMDGLSAEQESMYGTSDYTADTDGEGLTDYEEVFATYSSPTEAYSLSISRWGQSLYSDWQLTSQDSDGDNIPDRIEDYYGLQSWNAADADGDLDADGVSNVDQFSQGIALNANITRYDTDEDGMTDVYEDLYGLSKYDPSDAVLDADGDGVLNYEEAALALRSNTVQSRQGGVDDAGIFASAYAGIPGLVLGTQNLGDIDQDGLPDAWEHHYRLQLYPAGVDLRVADAAGDGDGDGLTNAHEYQLGTSPILQDTDSDGFQDGQQDTDGDGLTDAAELAAGTSHTSVDTDGDGISDGRELAEGTDPLDPASNSTALLGLRVFTPWVAAQ